MADNLFQLKEKLRNIKRQCETMADKMQETSRELEKMKENIRDMEKVVGDIEK